MAGNTTKRPQTPSRGAADLARQAILAGTRMAKKGPNSYKDQTGAVYVLWSDSCGKGGMREWLSKWDQRAAKRKRGLARDTKNAK